MNNYKINFKVALLTCICLLTSALFASSTARETTHYAMIIDAGSTGSRIHLFEYAGNQLPHIKDIYSANVKPGLSAFAGHPDAAFGSLKPLLEGAVLQLQKLEIDTHTVPISILGTAGMRLLTNDQQQAIYQNIKTAIQKNYFFPIKRIETISGKLEGIYAWLDINYLAKSFESTAANQPVTLGSIDIGGASSQIVFATHDRNYVADEMNITINGYTYTVFSKSFLGLGQDQMRAAINVLPGAAFCYPLNYPFQATTLGQFNFPACKTLYLNHLQKYNVSQQLPMITNQPFVAISAVYYDYHFFDVPEKPEQSVVEEKIQAVCNQTWEQLQYDYPKESINYLANYCANTVYVAELLYSVYGLSGENLTVTNQINGKNIDWTLGALLLDVFSFHTVSDNQ